MQTKFLNSGVEVHRALMESAEWCDRWNFCVSRADGGEQGPVEKLLASHGAKLRYAIVGLELHRTASELLRRLHDNESLRLVPKADGSFAPNLYTFERASEMRVVVGGASFADDAFTSEFQAATLSEASKSTPFSLAIQTFLDRCLRNSHLTTHADLSHYSRIRDNARQNLRQLSDYRILRDSHDEIVNTETREESTVGDDSKELPVNDLDNPKDDDRAPSATTLDDLDRSDVMITFRAISREHGPLPQREFLRFVARRLGYERLGKNVAQLLKGHLRAAIRREIVQRDESTRDIGPGIRDIVDYDPTVLVKTILAVIRPGTALDRDSTIRDAARYLGYRNVTEIVRKELRSAINRGIRRGFLIADRNELRRV
jgi:hypothetical protein